MNAEWSAAWHGWTELCDEARVMNDIEDAEFWNSITASVRSTLRRFFMLADQNAVVVHSSDARRRSDLECSGFLFGRASGDGNNCLADSLLQLLVHHGFLVDSITDDDRLTACAASRRALCGDPGLCPRDLRGRPAERAYLEHDRHAGPTIDFFMSWFHTSAVRPLPAAGLRLVVFTRFDRGGVFAETVLLAQPGAMGVPDVLHMYNSSGAGIWGFHYDPLFLCDPAVVPSPQAAADESDSVPPGQQLPCPSASSPAPGGASDVSVLAARLREMDVLAPAWRTMRQGAVQRTARRERIAPNLLGRDSPRECCAALAASCRRRRMKCTMSMC